MNYADLGRPVPELKRELNKLAMLEKTFSSWERRKQMKEIASFIKGVEKANKERERNKVTQGVLFG